MRRKIYIDMKYGNGSMQMEMGMKMKMPKMKSVYKIKRFLIVRLYELEGSIG